MLTKAEYEEIPENDRFNCVLEGTAYYSSVHKPNMAGVRQFDAEPVFITTLGLDEENQEKAEAMGLIVKEPNEVIPEPHVQIKRKVKDDKEPDDVKPTVVDSRQQIIPEDVLVGNGSKVAVKFATYWHRSSDKWGVGTVMFKMQVTDLVPYDPSTIVDPDLDMNEDGFSIETYLAGENEEEEEIPVDSVEEKEHTVPKATKEKKGKKKGATNPDIFD